MEYQEYLEKCWYYLPYLLYTYVFLTLLPKSLGKIINFAHADYEANRNKYHRCYGADLCCHALVLEETAAAKPKPRKPVTRIYPKRNSVAPSEPTMRRPVQTYTHVNQIARMFESGNATTNKKINRVTPTILPSELRSGLIPREEHLKPKQNLPPRSPRKLPPSKLVRQTSAEEFAQMLLAENLLSLEDFELIEQSEPAEGLSKHEDCGLLNVGTHWTAGQGTSATPSTASPAASCSPLSCSPLNSPRQLSPLGLKSSVEDIFAALVKSAERSEQSFICSETAAASLSPVTSFDDILAQRRLSRPLSAYSISDLLLNEENTKIGLDELQKEQFLRTLNKT